ncbi:hypothetical protein [Botrimarina sp.]|uniref:hypothetical protein n=1 Tax=Botrimarina sp. TaxID=2795802 RepID=UPI0032EB2576
MGDRLYAAVVIVLWLGAMSWLVAERILPPLTGDRAPMSQLSRQSEPVAWRIAMDDEPCGVAVLQSVPGSGGSKEVHSLLRIDRLESPDALPLWMRPFARSLDGMSFDMRTILMFDSLDRLHAFKTRIDSDSIGVPIRITGSIRSEKLKLQLSVAEIDKQFEHPWPSQAAFGGELTPLVRLNRLYQDRRWTTEVYSPFASPNAPVEMVEGHVEERLKLFYEGQNLDTWLVQFESMEKTGSSQQGRLRATLWVADDGRVLQQQTQVFGSRLTFLREPEAESQRLADELLELERYATTIPLEPPRADAPAP